MKRKRLLHQHPRLKSLWVMLLGQGLHHKSPKKHPKLPPRPSKFQRGVLGVFQLLRKLKPKILDHNDTHPVAEDMHIRKDVGLRLWRQSDPYAVRRRTAVDYRFHTKEQ